jgi:hypothetical protein
MKLESAVQIVADCILEISKDHDTVDPDEKLTNCGIITEFDLLNLKQAIINNDEIGVRSVKHEISEDCLGALNTDWTVMDLVMTVRNCALITPETVIDVDLMVRAALKKSQPARFIKDNIFNKPKRFERWLTPAY